MPWDSDDESKTVDTVPKKQELGFVEGIQRSLGNFWKGHGSSISKGVGFLVVLALHAFLGYAIAYNFGTAVALLALIVLTWTGLFYFFIGKPYFGPPLGQKIQPLADFVQNVWNFRFVKEIASLIAVVAFCAWIFVDTAKNRIRLVSFGGILCYTALSVVVSANPARIKWRPVIWGLGLQFGMGLLVLRWPTGHEAFRWASDQVVFFLDYTTYGTTFTYGFIADPPQICGMSAVFLYSAMQVIIYFGAIVSVLYYLGVIQFVLLRTAWMMQYTMGTTAAESLNAAACIFLGQTEAAILIKPALWSLTHSEAHAIMTAGFACIAGSLFAAYIAFGACPTYLLSATVMSAPASLAISKIIYPEVEKSKQKDMKTLNFPKGAENNILECISNGACSAVQYVWAIGANLIVFLALLALIDALIGYCGDLVGLDLSFKILVGYCFFPLAYVMGASDATDEQTKIDETLKVAQLMGTKTVLNEFIAYSHLSEMIKNNELGERAQMIAIYALCGFSNISSIGSMMGILCSMCPTRKHMFAKVVIRALIAGSFACFMTACVAGVLVDTPTSCPPGGNQFCLNLNDVRTYFNGTQTSTTATAIIKTTLKTA